MAPLRDKKPVIGWLTSNIIATSPDYDNRRSLTNSKILKSDESAIHSLEQKGFEVRIVDWLDLVGKNSTQLRASLDKMEALIIRSPWDYYRRPEDFLAVLEKVQGAGIAVCNSPQVVEWNSNKNYLSTLQKQGIPVIPLHIIKQSEPCNLAGYMRQHKLGTVVIKPVISAGSRGAYKVTQAETGEMQVKFEALKREWGDYIVSPFRPEIEQGEWNFVFMGGKLSHTVKKIPAVGNFLAHPTFGGRIEPADPSEQQRKTVEKIYDKIEAYIEQRYGKEHKPLYCRVDGVFVKSAFEVMEIELIEPNLFFEHSPHAKENFAQAIKERFDRLRVKTQ